ncbi:MAG TPA: four helix bundle protein [Candidatus Desulfobacillus sp.]|nr:four helix bundle protein [Candidatus Desulfobacillus sp.]
MSGKPHTRLEAWKAAMDLVEEVYRVTGGFPAHEQFGLVSRMLHNAGLISTKTKMGSRNCWKGQASSSPASAPR